MTLRKAVNDLRNSDIFLGSFADIESALRARLGIANGVPFRQVIQTAAKLSAEVRRYEDDLREFAELRNAIVHDRGGGRIIAEPNDTAVRELQAIADVITRPPSVATHFLTPVISIEAAAPVARAAELILTHSFSQLPVFDDQSFVGVLTANTIARWLGSCRSLECAPHEQTSVASVLRHAEDPEPFVFIDPNTTLARVLELFGEFENQGRELAALLIKEPSEAAVILLGIITISDLPRILHALPDLLPPGT